jgi:hypothetical protein
LRSQNWFDDPSKVDMVAFHLERVLASGYSLGELQSGKPVIGIAQTGSDITPCNRHHRELAARVRDGIRTAGGVAFEFPFIRSRKHRRFSRAAPRRRHPRDLRKRSAERRIPTSTEKPCPLRDVSVRLILGADAGRDVLRH